MQPADDPAGDDGDGEAEAEIGQRHLPADQREQQAERHLVDHRRGDQEREGDAERHAGGDEADEQRHGRAGAERRDDAERRRQHVADAFAPAGEQRPGLLRREEAAHDAHGEHDERQQHQHLRRVVDEEADRLAEMAPAVDRQRGDDPVREGDELAVDDAPDDQSGDRPAEPLGGRRAGARRAFGERSEAHAACLSLICRHRQRGVDEGDDRLRKVRSAAIAHPLGIAAVDHETGRLEAAMWRDMRDWVAPSSRISSQTQCSRPSHTIRRASRRTGSASAERIVFEFMDLPIICAYANNRI